MGEGRTQRVKVETGRERRGGGGGSKGRKGLGMLEIAQVRGDRGLRVFFGRGRVALA